MAWESQHQHRGNPEGKKNLSSFSKEITRNQTNSLIEKIYNHQIIPKNFFLFQFVNEDLCLDDVKDLMSRDDLRRLGLKTGPEIRVWEAIVKHREQQDKD